MSASGHEYAFSIALDRVWNGAVNRRSGAMVGNAAYSFPRFTRSDRIGWQRIHIRIGMPYQRHSLLDRLGPNESLALWGAVLVGGDGIGEYGHGVRMRERWLMGA